MAFREQASVAQPSAATRAVAAWAQTSKKFHVPTLIVVGLILAAWTAASLQYGNYLLPSPLKVLQGFIEIVASGELWKHVGASLYRISIGFGLACLVSLLAGLLITLSTTARTVARDFTTILNSTSVFVWIVVSLIWFGLTDAAPMFTTLMITLPVMLANILEGVENVDRKLLEMARVYKLNWWDRFYHITVPGTVPYIVAGMKVGFGLGLKVSVVAEIFGVNTGIGYMMNYSRDTLRTDMVFVWALVLILVMILVDKILFEGLSRRVSAWR
jgi:NitT/TauT family transport system permease protein